MAKSKDKKNKGDGDKRRASWILTEEAADDIAECFRNNAATFLVLGINAKTGTKILKREPVKKDNLKDFVKTFLEFLEDFHSGKHPFDGSKHRESDIKKAIKKYAPDGEAVKWSTLAELSDEE